MKKQFFKKISILSLIGLLILPCFSFGVHADIMDYFNWVDHFTYVSTLGQANRLLCKNNDVHILIYRFTNSLYLECFGPEFPSQAECDEWINKPGNELYVNYIVNGNVGSVSNKQTWTSSSYVYNDTSGTRITRYFPVWTVSVNLYTYKSLLSGSYFYFYQDNHAASSYGSFINDAVCYYYHGVLDSLSSNLINNAFSVISSDYKFPFQFGRNNSNGDQRTYDDENTQFDPTINLHPEDVFNTYLVNRNVQHSTVNDGDNYILPDAFDFNGAVIQNSDLRYQDFTYNTDYNVNNVNNYYTGGDDGNDNNTGDNGGNGSVNNSGVNINVSENAVNMTQSIEENAVNVTVNNNNNVNNEVSTEINNIVNSVNPEGGSFQNAVLQINEFAKLGSTFATLTTSFLGFLPSWASSLIGVAFVLLAFMIVMRLIHLFI